MGQQNLSGIAFSYIRFSSVRQERGDSLRRQTEARDKWLARHPGITLDHSLTLSDLGVSAFRGKHRADDKAALSQFIRAVESGRVKPGSYLIVESLDRLTREELGDAFELVLGLVNRGIRIVQLSPVESILEKPVNMTGLMLAIVELSRGRGESMRKSDLIGPAWAKKRDACRATGKIVTKMAKAWLTVRDGKFVFRTGAKQLIRRIFRMATAGHGCRAIACTLNREGVKPWAGKPWYEMYIRVLLRGREVRGEYQQYRTTAAGRREKDGDPVLGYYPEAVTEAEWQAAQAAAQARDNRGGRPMTRSDLVNVFRGLLTDARSGDALHVLTQGGKSLLMPDGFKRRGDVGISLPLEVFEGAVLSALAEIKPEEILDEGGGPDEVAELSAKLTRIDSQLKQMADLFDGDDVIPAIADKIRTKDAERKATVEALDRAKAKASSHLSSAWGECRGLVEALSKAKDKKEVRVRLRQAIARTVESIYTLFMPGRGPRVAAVQIWFAGGVRHRDYLILYRPPHAPSSRAAEWSVRSFLDAGQTGEFDLRKREDAADLERVLAAINPVVFDMPGTAAK